MKLLKLLLIALAANLAAGCSVLQDPRDRPWDPKGGRALFEQIPAWDGAALRQCGGHLPVDQAMREGRSLRC